MKKQIALFSTIGLLLTGCSTSSQNLEKWENFSAQKINKNLNAEQSLVVFYRPLNSTNPAVDIYVNREYQTSLLNGGVSAITLCHNNNLISMSYTSNTHFGNRTKGTQFTAPAQQISYVKLDTSSSKEPTFIFVPAEQAEKEMQGLKYQSHVLSRAVYKQGCKNQ